MLAELRASNAAFADLYAGALAEIGRLRLEYQPRSEWPPVPAPPEFAAMDPEAFKAAALAKIVELRLDLSAALKAAPAADAAMLADTRAQLDHVRAELAAANETIEQLKSSRDEWKSRANWAEGYDGGERKRLIEQRDQAQAKIGRAVAALRDQVIANETHGSCGLCGTVWTTEEWHKPECILANGDSKAAGEAWAEFEEEHNAITAYMTATSPHYYARLKAAMAAVDARRGGGR